METALNLGIQDRRCTQRRPLDVGSIEALRLRRRGQLCGIGSLLVIGDLNVDGRTLIFGLAFGDLSAQSRVLLRG